MRIATKTWRLSALGAGVAALVCVALPAAATPTPTNPAVPKARPWLSADQTPQQRAEELLAQMTLPEKVDLMTGNQGEGPYAYYNAPIPRLGIPALKMADSSAGVAPRGWTLTGTGDEATAMPSMTALGATWNQAQVREYAATVTNEVLDTGQNVLLGPDGDVVNNPWWGRADESAGEDPILNSNLNTAYTQVVQSKHVIADLKHYAGYNQETNRGDGENDIIDQRTLREVYTLAFEDVIKKANLGSVMCSFNEINGEYSCQNANTLRQLLKGTLGFSGFVLTDFGAIHDTVKALNGGTDMETGTTTVYDGALLAAVTNGQAPESEVDEACLRILTTMFRIGIFDHSYTPHPINVAADDKVALSTEEQAITLLKNQGNLLPLSSSTKSIAVIGADANFVAQPAGTPLVNPIASTTVLQGITSHAGSASVTWSPGNDPVNGASMFETAGMTAVPSSVLSPTNGIGTGLTTYYWTNPNFQGAPSTIRTEKQVNYDVSLDTLPNFAGLATQVPFPPNAGSLAEQSVVYDGHITAPATGDYTLALTGYGDATLALDGQQVITMTGADHTRSYSASSVLHLVGGQTYTLHITYQDDHPYASLDIGNLLLEWKAPANAQSPALTAAVAAARKAQVAVVFVRTFEGEQRDRVTLHLPESADQMINAVRAVNPNTIVVLANGGAVTMPWLSKVPAVVETYFGGQEQGAALANVLWGDVNPSGKLTMTFPTSDSAIPPGENNPWATADNLNVVYGQGVNVGYKGYDTAGIPPLFPFGYGLSYTTYEYSQLNVAAADPAHSPIHVRFTVTNTGTRAGDEIAQVYLGLPAKTGEPPKRLVGYARITTTAGQSTMADVTIDPNASTHPLGYFDTGSNRWKTAFGSYKVYVGGSERNTPLTATFKIT